MLKVIEKDPHSHKSTLDEICRVGARKMLKLALEVEVDEYIKAHSDVVDEKSRRLVVRMAKAKQGQ